ncbi:MAG: hypothetical protein KOO66_11210 [Bacteroidales bacterium]|nr:hypothetical protein [Bacteroidales bacterium]
MNFPDIFPGWAWIYFGTFGSVAAILFTLIVLNWMKLRILSKGYEKAAAMWRIWGFTFLFFAEWFACGIGGVPGALLSTDISMHYQFGGMLAAMLAMFFSVPGWICIFISQNKLLKGIKAAV